MPLLMFKSALTCSNITKILAYKQYTVTTNIYLAYDDYKSEKFPEIVWDIGNIYFIFSCLFSNSALN